MDVSTDIRTQGLKIFSLALYQLSYWDKSKSAFLMLSHKITILIFHIYTNNYLSFLPPISCQKTKTNKTSKTQHLFHIIIYTTKIHTPNRHNTTTTMLSLRTYIQHTHISVWLQLILTLTTIFTWYIQPLLPNSWCLNTQKYIFLSILYLCTYPKLLQHTSTRYLAFSVTE